MRGWLGGARGGLAAFVLIAALVVGGLGWMTAAVLRLEREQAQARAEAEMAHKLHLALWRLDSRVVPLLSREDSRLYNHYSFLYRPTQSLVYRNTRPVRDAVVLELSPLLDAELPEWMLLHFQAEEETGWASPQVPPARLLDRLKQAGQRFTFPNVTPARARLLRELSDGLPARTLLAAVEQRGGPATVQDRTVLLVPPRPLDQQQQAKGGQQPSQYPAQAYSPEVRRRFNTRTKQQMDVANSAYADNLNFILNNLREQGANWLSVENNKKAASSDIEVILRLGPMVPAWVKTGGDREYLVLLRQVEIAGGEAYRICQGVVLDTARIQAMLTEEVSDLFPSAALTPVRDGDSADPARTMATLPFQLEPGPADTAAAANGWTPLRVGLALAWLAAGVALLAVGLGGWSLLSLSERRFRFVSAVTHELRTPLTTLRLYLDMLLGGLVRDEAKRSEYIRTLHGEADRLNRLVNNVLDFSRLERQRPRLTRSRVAVAGLLAQTRDTWHSRCQDAGKELVIEDHLPEGAALDTDPDLLQQVLGNLIDNACKYSRDAEDPRVWLRAREESGRLVLEVEDRGPGVPKRERRGIFRAFRRGKGADATGGGVGLGLALARRWARLLGGAVTLQTPPFGPGALFHLELPRPLAG